MNEMFGKNGMLFFLTKSAERECRNVFPANCRFYVNFKSNVGKYSNLKPFYVNEQLPMMDIFQQKQNSIVFDPISHEKHQ